MARARQHMTNSGIPEADRQLEMFGTTAEAVTMLQALAKAWEPLGVRVKTTTNADGMTRLWTNRGMAGDVQMVTEGGTRADPHTTMQLALTKTGGWNVGGAAVPEIEPLVAKGAQTYNVQERQQIYAEIQELHAQHLYSILPGLYTSVAGFFRKGVTGLAFDANGKETWVNLGRA
jgi:ABC-type transport system substrate-binding protein